MLLAHEVEVAAGHVAVGRPGVEPLAICGMRLRIGMTFDVAMAAANAECLQMIPPLAARNGLQFGSDFGRG